VRGGVKELAEYSLSLGLIKIFGALPRPIAYRAAGMLAWLGFRLARRQQRSGLQNLRMAFPDLSVIFMTAHFGAWELSSFAHAVYGFPLKFLVRPIDNTRVESLISRYRTSSGNVPIQRRSAARDVLKALRQNEAVGILFDQNTTRSEGVFAEFFGIPAATTPSIALFALRTGAAVVPGFLIWDKELQKHRLRLDPPLELINTGDIEHDVLENTKLFNKTLESYIRKYPDQWLWIHRRWKTRPEGEAPIY
jgi:Kdo2-lipid IVA lauroyltransferase/acyltransferase